jgi:hypothetical protein
MISQNFKILSCVLRSYLIIISIFLNQPTEINTLDCGQWFRRCGFPISSLFSQCCFQIYKAKREFMESTIIKECQRYQLSTDQVTSVFTKQLKKMQWKFHEEIFVHEHSLATTHYAVVHKIIQV